MRKICLVIMSSSLFPPAFMSDVGIIKLLSILRDKYLFKSVFWFGINLESTKGYKTSSAFCDGSLSFQLD